MRKILLIDDESDALDVLEWKITTYIDEEVEIKKCDSPIKALSLVEEFEPDIVFLDIQMPQMDGFQFIEKFPERNFEVVFTTAYDEYALKAIKVSALDYILKPVDKDDLLLVFKKVSESLLDVPFSSDVTASGFVLDRISVSADGKIYVIKPDDVIMLKSDKSYTTIFTIDGKEIVVSKTLKEVEKKFVNRTFYRVHNSYLININHVQEYVKSDGGEILMTNSLRAGISRTKKKEFIDLIS